ncbi:MAG: tetratricopeptide repeat protein [Paludibacteraceae bacterium]|nr:tetratricopeptide repeat protein [Paludibacteraceae bacterium]
MLIACRPVRDAQQTVAVADSLRVHHGVAYDDSLALADAYATLGSWSLIYPDDYARACYYYGRLLRSRNDQVSAMRAFIAGTHAPYVQRLIPLWHFRDYHILARIYSNMGTMCHSAGEYQLSYEMYNKSAEYFLIADDSTNYYYTLNNEAFELATLHQYDEALLLLDSINNECNNSDVITITWETKVQLYFKSEQYDSVISAVNNLQQRGDKGSTGYTKKAQAFWYLQQYDSALYYANIVVNLPYASAKDKYNMMYILAYSDDSINIQEVKKRSEERDDIDKEILDPLHEQLALSVELLRQDRNKKPDYSPIIIICCFILLTLISLFAYKRHKNSTARIRKEEQALSARKQNLSVKEHELSAKELNLSVKEHELSTIDRMLSEKQTAHRDNLIGELERTCHSLRVKSNLTTRQGMEDYASVKKLVNKRLNMLVDKLEATNVLTEQKIKFCILVLLKVPQKQIAEILTYSEDSIKNTKTLIAKDLKTTSAELRNVLIDICLR